MEIEGDTSIRGVLVERGALCRVAVGFDAMGRTVLGYEPNKRIRCSRDSSIDLPVW